jgi:hypothetical protein
VQIFQGPAQGLPRALSAKFLVQQVSQPSRFQQAAGFGGFHQRFWQVQLNRHAHTLQHGSKRDALSNRECPRPCPDAEATVNEHHLSESGSCSSFAALCSAGLAYRLASISLASVHYSKLDGFQVAAVGNTLLRLNIQTEFNVAVYTYLLRGTTINS